MSKTELFQSVAAKANVDNKTAVKVCNTLLDVIASKVAAGVEVKIVGFGTFKLTEYGERMGRNPKTGEEIKIAARKRPFFKASSNWKKAVN